MSIRGQNLLPLNLSPDRKIAGVLAPLFALRRENDLGIGDLETLREFIDWAAEVGFKLVQLLPINETGGDHSPYNAISAVAIEPTTLHLAPGSPADLTQDDFDEVVRDFDLEKMRKGAVKHDRVRQLKMALLEKASRRFNESGSGKTAFETFCQTEAAWLDDYSFFRALMDENGGYETWDRWREEHRETKTAHEWVEAQTAEKQSAFHERRQFYRYVQWIAEQQWQQARAYAEERGIALMGDIPFGVNLYSADVYSRRDQFALDWSGGAPPEPYFKDDKFTQKWGQNWGIPLYRWDLMRSRNMDWWRWRVRGVRKIFHVFRIDHVLGFYRIYAFPWRPTRNPEFLPLTQEEMLERTGGKFPQFYPRDDSNWENCEANRREGEEYLRVVLEESRDTRVVGEDLGTVPDYVRPSLRSLGIAGFKIPQWENHPDGRTIPGSEYQRVSVATYATHDHKPVRAMWEDAFEQADAETAQGRNDLNKIASFAGMATLSQETDYDRDFYPAMMEALFRSESWLALVMITDLLARKDRFNVPGTAAGSNWSRRLWKTVAELRTSRAVRKRMNLICGLLEKTKRTDPQMNTDIHG
ncbi:MAG TPA: 4-alpha-glucanotransferase [Chthoniobacterales bacterium]|nr:4-alpha-glucanotransferase [Chthoniobacterales bacterium]